MINKLVSKIKKMGAPVVVGLDPMLNYVPEFVQKKAFEEYGESQYPFGFKCHWIKDLINIEQAGNTWYFKVGVTITNAYGAEYDTVAEGMVTGTDSAPQMVQFYVSN